MAPADTAAATARDTTVLTGHQLKKPLRFSLSDSEFLEDPYPAYAKMRQAGAVIPLRFPVIGSLWVTTTHAATLAVLKDKERFILEGKTIGKSGAAGLQWWMPKSWRRLMSNLLAKDEPDHRRLRKLVDKVFARHDILQMRASVTAVADRLLDAWEGEESAELVNTYARLLPLHVISEMLGVVQEDRLRFSQWSSRLMRMESAWDIVRMTSALRQITQYVIDIIERTRQTECSGLIADLVRAEADGDKLNEDELIAMVLVLMMAGMETTTNLISGGVLALEKHPEQKAWLLADPEARAEPAVEELLRYVSSVGGTKPRFVAHDGAFFGTVLRKGQLIMALPGAANADPSVFDAPEQLKLDRFPNPHAAFGSGIHFCLGMQLARLEGQVALTRLYERYPNLRIVNPDTPDYAKRPGHRALRSLMVQVH